jgi:hypothetical protein
VAIAAARGDDPSMRITYGVVWREGEAPLARGRLELLPRAVRLDGLSGSTPVLREVPYDELEAVRVGRSGSDRLNGHPTLVLEPRRGEPIVVAAVAQAGVVPELTERLAKLTLG